MKKYFKLNVNCLNNRQDDETNINENCLNYLFFYQIDENTFVEKFTDQKIIFNDNQVTYPLGLEVSINDFIPCSVEELLNRYNEIKNKNLNLLYLSIINDLFNKKLNENSELKRY